MKTFKQFLEAAGDPIKPEQVIKLGPKEIENLRKAEVPQRRQTRQSDPATNFVSRYIRNTSYLFPTPF